MSSKNSVVAITGAKGLLGSEFYSLIERSWPNAQVHALSHGDLDVADRKSVQSILTPLQPNLILNTAAYTNVDRAESEKESAWHSNVTSVQNLVECCQKTRAKLVHFSTDQVFDGSGDKPWTEEDIPNPLNTYASTKLEGEKFALMLPNAMVLRVQWLYGQKTPRFLHLKDRESFGAINDQFGAPTWVKDVAQATLELLEKDCSGLYHFAYDDHASWEEIFQFVKAEMGWNVTLNSVDTASLNLAAKRPRFAVLSNEKLRQALGKSKLGSWKHSLKDFLSQTTSR